MDKNTLIAIVLSVVVISLGFLLQNVLFPVEPVFPDPAAESVRLDDETAVTGQSVESTTRTPEVVQERTSGGRNALAAAPLDSPLSERIIRGETDLFVIEFSTRGAGMTSLRLKDHLDGDEYVEMIFNGETGNAAFELMFGDANSEPISEFFEYQSVGSNTFRFSRVFIAPDGVPFTLIKTYRFKPDEYLFELEVSIENSVNEYPSLDFGGWSYTLGFGPQIGPEFQTLGGRGEYRYYLTYEDGKVKKNRVKRTELFVTDTRFTWAGLAGKYFTLLAVPDQTPYRLSFSNMPVPGLPEASQFYLTRPIIKSARSKDLFRFYAGPITPRDLGIYNKADKNAYNLQDLNLDKAVDSSALLGWLETILKFLLVTFYRIIPNYGVAIILLTVVVKLLLYPITHKSFESTSKMQALNPKITEIREKYKDNPNKMNQEMAALYKREKVNPLGGCFPLLLQMPFFFAMYGLFNKHFDLRGAPFVLWITDLSAPDSIWNFAPTQLPLLGWSDLRILPILFIVTQLLSSLVMKTPESSSNKNMKLMQYFMPIFFFFILYDAPAGLLLYWTVTNVLTAVQQVLVTNLRQNKPEAGNLRIVDKPNGKTGKNGKNKKDPGNNFPRSKK